MAYDTYLAERINRILTDQKANFFEKKMFGGVCFMVNEKMCCGVIKDQVMARVNPVIYSEALEKIGASKMNFTGREMKGYIYINPEGADLEDDLEYWVKLCLDFNPLAKASKKKKSKT
jgi:TfoX/Sxy family transcriptional regulator of competence genes